MLALHPTVPGCISLYVLHVYMWGHVLVEGSGQVQFPFSGAAHLYSLRLISKPQQSVSVPQCWDYTAISHIEIFLLPLLLLPLPLFYLKVCANKIKSKEHLYFP